MIALQCTHDWHVVTGHPSQQHKSVVNTWTVIIDSYLNQIGVRAFEHGHRILCLPTHNMTLKREPTRVWSGLQHKIITYIDLSAIHTILIPLNISTRHWSLAHVNIENQEIAIYDSVHNKTTQNKYTNKLLKLLAVAPGLEDIE